MSDQESEHTNPAVSAVFSTPSTAPIDSEAMLDLTDDAEPVFDVAQQASDRRREPVDEPSVVDDLQRRPLFDLAFVDAADLGPVVDALIQRQQPYHEHHHSTVLTPNVDIMVQLDQNQERNGAIWNMFRSSQFCLPDGQPIVWASKVLGQPLSARLTGSGLFARIWPRLVAEERAIHLVASSEEVADRLKAEYPAVEVTVAPMFTVEDRSAIDQLAKSVIASAAPGRPEFVFLGIGNPKDALIADALLRQWPAEFGRPPTLLALGGAASMYVGITKRAPEWVQRIGMEWFFRFAQEPRRLFHRYFVRDTAFVGLVWREWRDQRRRTEDRSTR